MTINLLEVASRKELIEIIEALADNPIDTKKPYVHLVDGQLVQNIGTDAVCKIQKLVYPNGIPAFPDDED